VVGGGGEGRFRDERANGRLRPSSSVPSRRKMSRAPLPRT
jgi:hypothetical protein